MPYSDPEKQRVAGRESMARRMSRWRDKGMCSGCGKRPPAPGRVRCENCLQLHRESETRRRQAQLDRMAGRAVAAKSKPKPKRKRPKKAPAEQFRRDPEELRQLARDGLTKAEVARKLGISDGRVHQLSIAHGIKFISYSEKRKRAKAAPAPTLAVTVPAAEIVAAAPAAAPAPPKPKRKRVVRKRPPAAPPAPVEPPEVAKHNGHVPPPVPVPGNRRVELPRCAIRGELMHAGHAAAQMRKHPGSDLWPQCRDCEQRIARHVIGIRASRAARNDMLDQVEAEGDALPIDDVEHGGEPSETP